MVDRVDEGHTIATASMNRLDTIMSRMNNNNRGLNTTQMLSNMGVMMSSMRNVEGGEAVQNRALPLMQRMMDQLSNELDA